MDIDDSDFNILLDEEGIWRISYTDNRTYYDATDGMSAYLSDYVNFCKKGFDLDYVSGIQFYIFCKFLDANDNESVEKAVVVDVPKSMLQNEDWNIYTAGLFYWAIEDSADIFDVHSALANSVNVKDVRYIP